MKKYLFYIVPILILVILIILGYYFSSPSYLTKKYFKAYSEKNCTKIYNLIEKYKGDFTSLDYFKEVCEKNIQPLKDYEIENHDDYAIAKGNNVTITANYEKTDKKKFLIFNDYVIKNDLVNVVKNVTLKVPAGANSIKIDNITLDKYYVSTDENEIFDIYSIDEMFETTYIFLATYYDENDSLEESIMPMLRDRNFSIEFNNRPVSLYVFTQDGCRFCDSAVEYLDKLEETYGSYFVYTKYNNASYATLYNKVIAHFNIAWGAPLIVIGDDYIQGYNESFNKKIIQSIIHTYRTNASDVISTLK